MQTEFNSQMIEVLAHENELMKQQIIELRRRVESLENIIERMDSASRVYGSVKQGDYRPWLNNLN